MTTEEKLAIRAALALLDVVKAGLTPAAIFDRVELETMRKLTTEDRARLLRLLETKEWVYSFRNPVTDEIYYASTAAGSRALCAL